MEKYRKNLWNASEAVLTGKFIDLNAYITKEEKKILFVKINSKLNPKQAGEKYRAEINKVDNKKSIG